MLKETNRRQPMYNSPDYLDDFEPEVEPIPGVNAFENLQGLAGGADWQQVQEDVNHELEGRIALAGMLGAGKRSLVGALRGQSWTGTTDGSVLQDGFFLVVNLPEEITSEESDFLLDYLQTVDMIVYCIDGEEGVRPSDISWISLIRSRGMNMLGVLSKADQVEDFHMKAQEMSMSLALPLTPIVTLEGKQQGLKRLIEQMLKTRSRLGIPLAREVPLARPLVTERIIRQSAITAAILGATPAPVLDLPLQVTNHMRMALRIGAAHGQPGADYLSREMMGAVGASIGLRYLIQQVIRLVPVIGWAVNALINAISTYLLGRTLAAYYASNWDAMTNKEILEASNPLPKIAQTLPIKTFHWPFKLDFQFFRRFGIGNWWKQFLEFVFIHRHTPHKNTAYENSQTTSSGDL